MATQDFVQTELHPDSLAESSLDHPLEVWAPPLAPTGNSLRQVLGPANQPLEKNEFAETGARFGPHRKLVAGSVIVAALGMAALAYIWASPGD